MKKEKISLTLKKQITLEFLLLQTLINQDHIIKSLELRLQILSLLIHTT